MIRRVLLVALATLASIVVPITPAGATAPSSVTLAGSLQSELGCPGDWQPDCSTTHLAHYPATPVWAGTFAVPSGSYEYKVAVNDSWDENYGAGGVANGTNLALALAAGSTVRFYYDEQTHWIANSASNVIATVPGSFQSELGCPGDWQPDCLASLLEDLDGDGVSSFATTAIPAGGYEAKVAINESWDENYGAGGAANGANLGFTIPPGGATTTFRYDQATHVLTITVTADDGTPPTISASLAPPANALGWNNTDVQVSFACDDHGGSGVATVTPPVTVSTEGAGQSVAGTCTDVAGNSASTVVSGINIDRTAPTVAFTGNAATYDIDQAVAIACAANDERSGIASSNCPGAAGPATSFGPGTVMLSGSATDNADNTGSASTTFTVTPSAGGVCRLTRQYVTSGPRYGGADKLHRAAADATVAVACRMLDVLSRPAPALHRRIALAAYTGIVGGLARGGWLTGPQSSALASYARAI